MNYIQLVTGTIIHYLDEDSEEHYDYLEIMKGYINTAVGYIEGIEFIIPLHQIVARWKTN